jgi:hypothetical protein
MDGDSALFGAPSLGSVEKMAELPLSALATSPESIGEPPKPAE